MTMSVEAAGARRGPVRMCGLCRERFAKGSLARYAPSADGRLTPDPEQKRPGRGFYVCAGAECAARLQKRLERQKGAGNER